MKTIQIYIAIVDENPEFSQCCLILYHGDKVALEVKEGHIDSCLREANIFFDWGFTLESLNDCLLKICEALQNNSPNVVNAKYAIKNTYWEGDIITEGEVIIWYNIAS